MGRLPLRRGLIRLRYDVVIRDGLLVDGTGGPPTPGDLAIVGDRIVTAGGSLAATEAAVEIDAQGLIVAPGFIDTHAHDDRALLEQRTAPKVSQGVTTVVTGNCGISLAPLVLEADPPPPLDVVGARSDYRFKSFAQYLDAVDAAEPQVNAAFLVGHSTLRVRHVRALDEPATPDEIDAMKDAVREALEAGAVGLSTGLFYAPASASPPDEVLQLLGLLAGTGAVYTTHMRDEGDRVMDSLEETLGVAREADVPVVISHHKVVGRSNFGRSEETLRVIDDARGRQDVGLDAYPYTASSTVLRPAMVAQSTRVLVTWSTPHPEAAGRDLKDLADGWGVTPEAAADRLQPGGAIYWSMDEADVRRVLAFEGTMIGSDGLPHDAHPHPRLWGTFPRVLGRYSRELGLFSIEEAVRRMTSLPAERFRLAGRGTLSPGAFADVCIFDPTTVIDRATFEDPQVPAAGIAYVFVNGTLVWERGAATGASPGRALRRRRTGTLPD